MMSKKEYSISWAGVVFIRERKYLATKERNKSFVLVPGGKVDPGETDEQAATREVREELAVNVRNLKPLTTVITTSKKTGQSIRFRMFTGELVTEPDPDNLPRKTEAFMYIDSSSEDNGFEIGNLSKKLIPILVEKDMID